MVPVWCERKQRPHDVSYKVIHRTGVQLDSGAAYFNVATHRKLSLCLVGTRLLRMPVADNARGFLNTAIFLTELGRLQDAGDATIVPELQSGSIRKKNSAEPVKCGPGRLIMAMEIWRPHRQEAHGANSYQRHK